MQPAAERPAVRRERRRVPAGLPEPVPWPLFPGRETSMERIERDFLGELALPAQAYWGIHTERARRNFPLSGYRVNSALIAALAKVKKACCLANAETGYLRGPKVPAILQACDEIAAGSLADQFPLDALQGGAGTSTNMNLNEVIANREIGRASCRGRV